MPALTSVDVEFVSLVDRAAVRDPVNQAEPNRFLIWKRDKSPSKSERKKTPMSTPITDDILKQLGDAVDSEATLAEFVEKAEGSEEVAKALTGALRLISAHKSDLPDGTLEALAKAAELELPKTEVDKTEEPKSTEDLVKSLEKSDIDSAIVSEVKSALEKAQKAEEVEKADLPPAVREALEKAEKDRKEADEKIERAEKIAREERDTRLNKEFVAKAETYEGLTVKAEEFGPVLKEAAEKLSEENFKAIDTLLKAADKQIAEGELFKEQGAGGSRTTSDAYAEAEKRAGEIQKSDSKLSKAQAIEKAFDDDPALQERYLAEIRG